MTLINGGILGGNGTSAALVVNGGMLAPGNSIGTLTVNGNFAQTGGTYQVEVNPEGQSDRVNVAGTATINGGTVQVLAAPGGYATSTTYTILNATGGVGRLSGVASNYAFLTPTLSYDANDVYLTLALQGNAFAASAAHVQPVRRRLRARPGLRQRHRRLRHGDQCARRPQHVAGPAGAQRHQRPAVRRLRHGEHGQQLVVHECARPADGACPRRGTGQRQALAQACEVESCDARAR